MSEKIASLYAEIGGTTAPLEQALGETTDSLNIFETQLGQAGDATDEFGQTAADTAGDMDELADSADGVESSGGGVKEQFNALRQGLGAFNFVMGAAKVAFDEVTSSADRLGRTELGDSMDKLDVTITKVKDSLITMEIGGRDTIAWVTDAIDGFDNYIKMYSALGVWIGQTTGLISDEEAAARAAALVHEDVAVSIDQLAQAERDLADPTDETNRLLREQVSAEEAAQIAAANATQAAYDQKVAMEELTGPTSDLSFAMGELNTQNLFNAASAGLSGEQQLALAVSLGVANTEALEAKNRLDALRIQYNITDAAVAAGTADVDGYAAAVARMNDELAYAERQAAATAAAVASAFANGAGVNAGGGVVSGGSGGMAEGGIASGPSAGYPMTLHGTEAVIPLQNGSIPVQLQGGGGGSESMMWEMIGLLRNLPLQISRAIRDALLAMGK